MAVLSQYQGHSLQLCCRPLYAAGQGLRQSLPEVDREARIGAVVFIHRFGGLMNGHLAMHSLRSHFHVIVIDGLFTGEDAETLRFQEVRLTPEGPAQLQMTIRKRIINLFTRRGLLDKDTGEAMCRCEHDGGFSLDAGVRIEANDRQGLERLLRYCAPKEVPLGCAPKEVPLGCARPAFAQERLRQIDPEHLVYESPKPGPGGRVSQILTPLELLDRLAALIPPPRRHRHRYYDQRKSLWDGVLAPNAPQRKAVTALASKPKPVALSEAEAVAEETPVSRAVRYAWAMLLARIYDQRKSLWDEVFPLSCPKCGGTIRIIAFMNEGEAIREILLHLGEPVDPPRIAPARGPPLWEAVGPGSADSLAQPMPEFEFDQRIVW